MDIPKQKYDDEASLPILRLESRKKNILWERTNHYLRELIGRTLRLPAEGLKEKKPFDEYGFSSLAVVSITQELEDIFDELPVTIFFEYYTIEDLTDYLFDNYTQALSEHFDLPYNKTTQLEESKERQENNTPLVNSYNHSDLPSGCDIAIIGLDGRYPNAENITEFWDNLVENKDCITEIPPERWNWRTYFSPEKGIQGKIYSKWGGFIRDVDCFDPLFFNISPFQAEQMDPSERLFMQAAYSALEDAGYTRDTLDAAHRVGVFAATTIEEYQPYSLNNNLGLFMSNSASIANRISYFCNFNGPSLTLNTMCSSSLSAIHLACQSIIRGECAAAIAGAVNISIHPSKYAYLSHKQFLSTHGRCMAFSAQGDGYVPSEGVGAIVLKPLAQAMDDGDHIYGVIKGIAINHGGKTNGYSVPSPQSQANVIRQAIDYAGIDARAISYIEAHGTGTSLGDPIEIEGLNRAFLTDTDDKQFCAIGSIKSNIGHCESAAGMASLTKVLLQMQHGMLVKSLHSEELNPNIKFSKMPFIVQRKNAPWERPVLSVNGVDTVSPRIAGLSSFGAGGSNAHMIISESPPQYRQEASIASQRPVIIVLSAANQTSLTARLNQLANYLSTQDEINLNDLAYTLQIGREAMAVRIALVVENQHILIEKIQAILANNADITAVYQGEAGESQVTSETIVQALSNTELNEIAQYWVNGESIDWPILYSDSKPMRLSLPTYPFARERYWLPPLSAESNEQSGDLHPLVHRNISDVHGVCFSTLLTGREIFLRDHLVHGKAVVPAAAQLEWVSAALIQAQVGERDALSLEDVVWLQPLVVEAEREIFISLYTEDEGCVAFELYSKEGEQEHVYCRGTAVTLSAIQETNLHVDLAGLQADCQPIDDLAEKYAYFNTQGIYYGPALRALIEASTNGNIALGKIDISTCGLPPALHGIALIDNALQTCAALGGFTQLCLPFVVTQWRTWGDLPEKAYAVVRTASPEEYDIDLIDMTGRIFMQLIGVRLRFFESASVGQVASEDNLLLVVPDWRERQLPAEAALNNPSESWVVVCEMSTAVDLQTQLNTAHYFHLEAQGTSSQRYTTYAEQLLSLLQNNTELKQAVAPVKLQFVVGNSGESSLMQGLVLFLRSIEEEFSQFRIQMIALDDKSMPAQQLVTLLRREAQQCDPIVRYQAGLRTVLSWKVADTVDPTLPWRDEGVYWITGGLGGLGHQLAEAIADTVTHPVLILSTRHIPTTQQRQFIDALRAKGATVDIYPLDVSDSAAVAQAVSTIVANHGHINGILHCAGIQRDGLLQSLDEHTIRAVMAAKVAGIEALDDAIGNLPLDWMLLSSSLAAVQGNLGQSGYAAANAYLDRYAEYRQQQVIQGEKLGVTISVNWPLFSDGGMQLDTAGQASLRQTTGLVPMPIAKSVDALKQIFALSAPQVAVLYGEQTKLHHWLDSSTESDFMDTKEIVTLVNVNSEEQKDRVVNFLKDTLAKVIKLPASRIDSKVSLDKYGFDSVIAISLNQSLSTTFGKLPISMFFENQSIDALARYLINQHSDKVAHLFAVANSGTKDIKSTVRAPLSIPISKRSKPKLWRQANSQTTNNGDIAIIGLSGRYPQADNIDQFWQNLVQGRDCISEIPIERWDWHRDFDEKRGTTGKSYGKWGGFIDDVDCFDPLFFQILPSDAERMDPQERLFLQCAWSAIEDAGYTRANLLDDERLGGVFTGVMNEEYQLYTPKIGKAETSPILQGVSASIANRLSWICNFRGPSMTINTMCSSSLTAIHLACQSIRQGECSVAIAGGVNVNIHPNKYLALSEMGFLSSQGRCTSFAAGGDGYVPSEGVGAAILKPLSHALADGDHIYGVIKGSAVNHGGKTHGYTVPNPQAQAQTIERAIKIAGIDSRTISYIEAHGTGTELGDPIEMGGLIEAFTGETTDKQFCAIGSVKSNIGHCESAAGIAGLTKILLQMQHGQLVKSLHSEVINPHIDFTDTPFVLQQKNQPWVRPVLELAGKPREYPLLAGLSSFGAGGANAHVIVEEFQSTHRIAVEMPVIIVLSARTYIALQKQIQDIAEYLTQNNISLVDAAWTLQVGREEMAHRVALVVETKQILIEKLNAIITGSDSVTRCYFGEPNREQSVLSILSEDDDLRQLSASWIAKGKLDKLAELWVQGLDIDWRALYGTYQPQRISLPTYPFARERCWVSPPVEKAHQYRESHLHPLVHCNTSTFERQRYTSYLTGREWFLTDHHVQAQPVVPGVVQLEWARAAVSLALESQTHIQLQQVMWLRPLIVTDEMTIHIALQPQSDSRIGYEIYSADDDTYIYSRGYAVVDEQTTPKELDLAALLARCDTILDHDFIYTGFEKVGLHYGTSLRLVKQIHKTARLSIGELLPQNLAEENYVWPVELLDAALQSSIGLLTHDELLLPIAAESVKSWNISTALMYAVIEPAKNDAPALRKWDITLVDENGTVGLQLLEVTLRQAEASSNPKITVESIPAIEVLPSEDDITGLIEQALSELIASYLKLPIEELDRNAPFAEFGFDSINLGGLGNELNTRYGLKLSTTIFFEAPTIATLAARLAAEESEAFINAFDSSRPIETIPQGKIDHSVKSLFSANWRHLITSPTSTAEPIAVIGMSGSFPQSPDIDAFWRNLEVGKNCISELPQTRWHTEPSIRHAGILDNIAEFDPLFFGISPREAKSMDPQQRLLMMYVHNVLEDAGYSVESLSGSNSALLVGTGNTGYEQLLSQGEEPIAGFSMTGVVSSIGPNRMSYWLNWHGPSEPIETACSSSLVAIHRAMELLRAGLCDQAVVGGVNTLLSFDAQESFAQAGMLSHDGRCNPFSAQANGYVRSEGVGMLMLKPLTAAQRDGDHIYGLLLGSAENHGGRAASLSSPNPNSQAKVIEDAFRQANVDPSTVNYIETHGTGTLLGDPIEIMGLHQAFGSLAQDKKLPSAYCGLGSVKSNIGHTELSSGVAGVIKVLLQMRHQKLVASLNCTPNNPQISLEKSPFHLVNQNQFWPKVQDAAGNTLPRRAGVSSFSFGGVNAHIVMEEYLSAPKPLSTQITEPVLIVLSAQSEWALDQRIIQLRDHLQLNVENLDALAYTLQVGRDAMKVRVAFIAESHQALMDKLTALIHGTQNTLGIWRSNTENQRNIVNKNITSSNHRLSELAEAWVKGADVDWQNHWLGRVQPTRLSLPTYPFELAHYWPQPAPTNNYHFIHPLIESNTSDLHEQRYTTTLTGNEWFLRDHQVKGNAIVPGAVLLEWARAAVSIASGVANVTLCNLAWIRALTVIQPITIHIVLEPQPNGSIGFEIYSDHHSDEMIYCQGEANITTQPEAPSVNHNPADLMNRARQVIEGEEFYARLANKGLQFGKSLQVVKRVCVDTHGVLSQIETGVNENSRGYVWLPELLDGAMQTIAALAGPNDDIVYPFALQQITSWQTLPARVWARVTPINSEQEVIRKWDILIHDEQGKTLLAFSGVSFREAAVPVSIKTTN